MKYSHLAEITISSILRIILTHSVANVNALDVIKDGYTTFSNEISSLIPFLLKLIPAFLNPLACLVLNSVTTLIGFNPAFSANVNGITSKASA